MSRLVYVDLGCKVAGAIDNLRKKGPRQGLPRAHPHECLGVDQVERFKQDVEAKGYQFACVNLPDPDWQFPAADCYIAWNFLEHLDSIEEAQDVVQQMILSSRVAVSLLMPSFEPDTAVRLRERGYEWPWFTMVGHHAFVTKAHVDEAVGKVSGRVRQVDWRPKWPVTKLVTETLTTIPGVTPKPGPIKPRLDGAWEGTIWRK